MHEEEIIYDLMRERDKLRAEVERLRAEVQRLDIAGTHSCHDDCPKLPCAQRREIERLRVELAAAKDQYHELACAVWACSTDETIPDTHQKTVREAKRDVTEAAKLRLELAAAKAASVCPVEVVTCYPDDIRKATVVLWSNADAQRFACWLRDRMKERGNQ